MQVLLEAIKFNHDPTSETTGAFYIRRNETRIVKLPEWERGSCSNPGCSPAAYALCQIPSPVIIQASFLCDDHTISSIKVRAKAGASGATTGILGEISEHEIPLNQGASGYQNIQLSNAEIANRGVAVSNVVWHWQFLDKFDNWTEFERTNHRIYVVASPPTKPWQPCSDDPSNSQVPWTEVLDYSCEWAKGSFDAVPALERVTRSVNQLGPKFLHYPTDGQGSPHFIFKDPLRFDCTSFLNLLNGLGSNVPSPANCDDCAAIVSIFANILGCDVPQSSMAAFEFPWQIPLRSHKKIGLSVWRENDFFDYHTAAWKGTEADPVSDACLELDARDPADRDPIPLLAMNMPFALRNVGYRDRLMVKGNDNLCKPLPQSTLHCRVGRSLGKEAFDKDSFSVALAERNPAYAFDEWAKETKTFVHLSLSNFFASRENLADWTLRQARLIPSNVASSFVTSSWDQGSDADAPLIRIDAFECGSFSKVVHVLAQTLGQLQLPGVAYEKEAEFGDIVFSSRRNFLILFARHNLVFFVRNVGGRSVDIRNVGILIDQVLLTLPQHMALSESQSMEAVAMTHELNGKWRTWIVQALPNGLRLVPDGELILVMPSAASGQIDPINSSHGANRLEGEAQPLDGGFSITIRERQGAGNPFRTYSGFLIERFEGGKVLVICGQRRGISENRTSEETSGHESESENFQLPAQQDGDWVATKP